MLAVALDVPEVYFQMMMTWMMTFSQELLLLRLLLLVLPRLLESLDLLGQVIGEDRAERRIGQALVSAPIPFHWVTSIE